MTIHGSNKSLQNTWEYKSATHRTDFGDIEEDKKWAKPYKCWGNNFVTEKTTSGNIYREQFPWIFHSLYCYKKYAT